jgi:hypothetical protein
MKKTKNIHIYTHNMYKKTPTTGEVHYTVQEDHIPFIITIKEYISHKGFVQTTVI